MHPFEFCQCVLRGIFKNADPNNEGFCVPFKTESLTEANAFFVKVQSNKGPSLISVRTSSLAPYLEIGLMESQRGPETGCTNFRDPGKGGSLYHVFQASHMLKGDWAVLRRRHFR